jgi:vacuole morphology and inheritance protein 14
MNTSSSSSASSASPNLGPSSATPPQPTPQQLSQQLSVIAAADVLSPTVLKNLSDRNFDKRKLGALEIEKAMRRLKEQIVGLGALNSGSSSSSAQSAQAQASRDTIRRVIGTLVNDFATSANSNNRKGGLIALASCAIGLTSLTNEHLDSVVPAVLKSFSDQDPRVRYYACEALFNITKICREAVQPYLPDIFVGLCKLVPDVDQEVKNGAGLFDRLLKEVVMEGEFVNVERFVPLLKSHMASANPYVRTLLVGWIVALDSIPGVDMLDHLPALLEGLFEMLSDGNKEVRTAADNCLGLFLDRLHQHALEGQQAVRNAALAAAASGGGGGSSTSAAATTSTPASTGASGASSSAVIGTDKPSVVASILSGGMPDFSERVQFRPLVEVLIAQTGREKDKFTRKSALDWLSQFMLLGRSHLAPVYDKLLATLLRSLSYPEAELVDEAARACSDLLLLIRHTLTASSSSSSSSSLSSSALSPSQLSSSSSSSTPADALGQSSSSTSSTLSSIESAALLYDPSASIKVVIGELTSRDRLRRSTALKSAAMFLEESPLKVREQVDTLLSALLSNFLDSGDSEVLKLNLEIIARLAVTDLDFFVSRISVDLVKLCGENRTLLEQKASFIVRRLCLLLEPQLVILSLSNALTNEPNRDFATLFVDLLNLILLTSLELSDFRDSLRGCCSLSSSSSSSSSPSSSSMISNASMESLAASISSCGTSVLASSLRSAPPITVFLVLFKTWTLNPVASISLSLLCEAYELCERIVNQISEVQVTVGLLMQVDKLVQLLESPIFLVTRMHLLEPSRRDAPFLLGTLYGLLMIMPQGTAFTTLKERLSGVVTLHQGRSSDGGGSNGMQGQKGERRAAEPTLAFDIETQFAVYADRQRAVKKSWSQSLKTRSLLAVAASAAKEGIGREGRAGGGVENEQELPIMKRLDGVVE